MWSDVLCLFIFLNIPEKSLQNYNECYTEEPSCLKCSSKGCVKCSSLIVYPSRRCVDSCPFGYVTRWSKRTDFMGQLCERSSSFIGLSADGASILFGILCGAVLCSVIIIAGVLYFKHKQRQLPQLVDTSSDMDDSPERRDFVKQLEVLRPYAKTYLDMLNDTRRQMRELHQEGDFNSLAAYKPVLRDLAKILLLLNRPVDCLTPPSDWEHLYNWAEKALKRYKRMSETSQMNQLVRFLQTPVEGLEEGYSRVSMTMSTFKPDQPLGSTLSLQDRDSFTLNPQWQFHPVNGSQFPSSQFVPGRWKNSREYLSSLYLEDDFVQFGFRPQDEITTEL